MSRTPLHDRAEKATPFVTIGILVVAMVALVVAAVGVGLQAIGLWDSPFPHPGGHSPSPTSGQPKQVPPSLVKASLSVGNSMSATVYFGRLGAVVAALDGQVTFNTQQAYLQAHPDLCVGTVVVSGVPGSKGAVNAINLGSGWGAAEGLPNNIVEGSNRNLHQQLVTPPPGTAVGQTVYGGVDVQGEGFDVASSDRYSLTLVGPAGNLERWDVDGTSVDCSSS
jgi:hypothetical protein